MADISEGTNRAGGETPTTRAAVTRVEWGVIASLLISALSLAFSFGVIYADVQRHEQEINAVQTKVEGFGDRIARIDTNITWLVEHERERRK